MEAVAIAKRVLPEGAYYRIAYSLNRHFHRRKLNQMLEYFHRHPDEEALYERELERFKEIGGIAVFPYEFTARYEDMKVDVFLDKKRSLPYVVHNGKRLYFPGRAGEEATRRLYRDLLTEQDIDSPHRYFRDNFTEDGIDTFFDVGAAEGIVALDLVDKVDHLVVFEYEPAWVAALEATFEPYREKTTIVAKMVSETTGGGEVRLDDYSALVTSKSVVKMDVEGNEMKVLLGATTVLSKGPGVLCCTYHRQGDAQALEHYLSSHGYGVSFSNGVMCYFDDRAGWNPPYFRKGLIRALPSRHEASPEPSAQNA